MPTQASRRAPHTANSIAAPSQAARQAVLAMRANDEIGDDAFHQIEEELDWLEMAGGRKGTLRTAPGHGGVRLRASREP